MSMKQVMLGAALAASALLSLSAIAADYTVTGEHDIKILRLNEVDLNSAHYKEALKKLLHIEKEIDVEVPDPVDTDPVMTLQGLDGEEFQLDGKDYINTVTLPVDADTAQGDPDGINESQGNENHQDNKDVVTTDPADTFIRQSLTNNRFNTDPADGTNPIMHNTVDFSITADGPITEDIAVNAAAGAFNLQANSMVTAIGAGLLGQSQADVRQDSLSNGSVMQDTTNEIFSVIDLENVTANVGINLVSGVGNEQINSFTATTSIGPAP